MTDSDLSKRVPASEVGRRIQIIGNLGKPLGNMMTIRGHWIDPEIRSEKGGDSVFVVTEIDGIKQNKPINIHQYYFHYVGGIIAFELGPMEIDSVGTWELRGYETGGYQSIPQLAFKEYAECGPHRARGALPTGSPRDFGFYCEFVYAAAKPAPD